MIDWHILNLLLTQYQQRNGKKQILRKLRTRKTKHSHTHTQMYVFVAGCQFHALVCAEISRFGGKIPPCLLPTVSPLQEAIFPTAIFCQLELLSVHTTLLVDLKARFLVEHVYGC
jgi:hypothetical protein